MSTIPSIQAVYDVTFIAENYGYSSGSDAYTSFSSAFVTSIQSDAFSTSLKSTSDVFVSLTSNTVNIISHTESILRSRRPTSSPVGISSGSFYDNFPLYAKILFPLLLILLPCLVIGSVGYYCIVVKGLCLGKPDYKFDGNRDVASVNGITLVKDTYRPSSVSVNGITLIENAFKPDANPLSGRSPSRYSILSSPQSPHLHPHLYQPGQQVGSLFDEDTPTRHAADGSHESEQLMTFPSILL